MIGEREHFWMHLHDLSTALEDAGLTRDERLRAALVELDRLPPLVRRELLRELTAVAADLLDLQPLAMAAVNNSEQSAVRHAV